MYVHADLAPVLAGLGESPAGVPPQASSPAVVCRADLTFPGVGLSFLGGTALAAWQTATGHGIRGGLLGFGVAGGGTVASALLGPDSKPGCVRYDEGVANMQGGFVAIGSPFVGAAAAAVGVVIGLIVRAVRRR